MNTTRPYTPSGMQDRLPEELAAKRQLEARLRTRFANSGYREVETPALEFYDSYACGQFAEQAALFKLVDDDGRLLALRYDGTIPVARLSVNHAAEDEGCLRYAYIAPVFRFRRRGGRPRAFTQAGVELIGPSAVTSDAEVIALAIRACEDIGLDALHVAIGQTAYFRALFAAWAPQGDLAAKLPRLIDEKNEVAVRALLGEEAERFAPLGDLEGILMRLLNDSGDWAELDALAAMTREPRALEALDRLRRIADLLERWGLLERTSPDLGQLQDLDYYSDITFRGYTYGVGAPVVSGGRYDQVHAQLGRDRPATGFSLDVDLCLQALAWQGVSATDVDDKIVELLVAPGEEAEADRIAEALRAEGEAVAICWPEEGQNVPPSRASRRQLRLSELLDKEAARP